MRPEESAWDELSDYCFMAAKGFISKDPVSVSTPRINSCLELPSLLSSTKNHYHQSISCRLRLSQLSKDTDYYRTIYNPRNEPPSPPLHFYHKIDFLEPARLQKTAREPASQLVNSLYQSCFTVNEEAKEHLEVDLGSSEVVSDSDMHACELAYQQEQFEHTQWEGQQQNSDNLSLELVSVSYAGSDNCSVADMDSASQEAPASKRIKLTTRAEPCTPTKEASQRISMRKEVPLKVIKNLKSPKASKSSNSSDDIITSNAKTEWKPTRKRSASLSQGDFPAIDGEMAEDLIHKVFGEEVAKKMLSSRDIRIEIQEEGIKTGLTIEKSQPVKKYTEIEVQTVDMVELDKISETNKKAKIDYIDNQAQTDCPAAKVEEKMGWNIHSYDQSPLQRSIVSQLFPKELSIDFVLMIQPRESYIGPQASCDDEVHQDVAIGAERIEGLGEYKMTKEEKAKAATDKKYDDDGAQVSGSRVGEVGLLEACELEESRLTSADEADAVYALKCLFSSKVPARSMERSPEGTVPSASLGNTLSIINTRDPRECQDQTTSEEYVDMSITLNDDYYENVDLSNRKGLDMDSSFIPIVEQASSVTSSTSPTKRKPGRKGQTVEEKFRLRENFKGWLSPPRRSSRSLNQVDYKESGRAAFRDNAEDKTVSPPNENEFLSTRVRKSTAEGTNQGKSTSTHPKQKLKKGKHY